jgi:hypothetical protein
VKRQIRADELFDSGLSKLGVDLRSQILSGKIEPLKT